VRPFDVYDLKAVLLDLLQLFGASVEVRNHHGEVPFLHPGVGARVWVDEQALGVLGQLNPKVAQRLGIGEPVCLFELSLDPLLARGGDGRQYQPVPRYPASSRDLALVMPASVPYGEVESVVARFRNDLVESVDLASIYQGDPIPTGQKSVALSVTYRSSKGSLTDKKVDKIHQRLVAHLCKALDAELR
jgi:phenylalanyl-tRNA synthetase beta chain